MSKEGRAWKNAFRLHRIQEMHKIMTVPLFLDWKKAGIFLILESMKDRKYWIRLNTTIEHFNLPIDTWDIDRAIFNKSR